MRSSRWHSIWLLSLIVVVPQPIRAADTNWYMIGAAGGVDDGGNEESFSQYETFGAYLLPWSWEPVTEWRLGTYVEVNAGALSGGGETAFVASAGPGLYLMTPGRLVSFWWGVGPTYISQHEFGAEDLGGAFQVTSHVGVDLNIKKHINFGYRFQHMSNADIYTENPGVNLHMLVVGFRF